MSLPKDHADLLKFILKHGWKRKKDGVGHWRLIGPEGQEVRASNTPRDKYFAGVKLRNDLIKAGFRLKQRPGYIAPPEAKLVVDKAVKENLVAETEKTEVVRKYGGLRETVYDVLLRMDIPQGRTAEDILSQVGAKIPNATAGSVGSAMARMVDQGRAKRISAGRYSAVPGTTAPAMGGSRGKGSRKKTGGGASGDLAVLEEALATLAKLEQVVKKYQAMADKMAALKDMFGG